MQGTTRPILGAVIAVAALFGLYANAEDYTPVTSVLISVAEQKLIVLRDGGVWKKYPISTSKFGVGDSFGSYKTPVGQLKICQKVGEDLAPGAVIKKRHATGEVLPANAPGRDPIVTRILWLDGLEPQNQNARGRGIYIHGTTEEKKIGEPVSYGCIRMRSKDVLEVFDDVPLDTAVTIVPDKLPKLAKYVPRKPVIIAAVPPPPPAPAAPAVHPTAQTAPPAHQPAPAPTAAPVSSTATTSGLAGPTGSRLAGVSITAPAVRQKVSPSESKPSSEFEHLGLKGSILMSGLPDGPKITAVPSPAPSAVPRFSSWATEKESSKGLSLDAPVDLSPAIQAANEHSTVRQGNQDAAVSPPEPAPAKDPAKDQIAFRANPAKSKAKP